MTDNAWRLLVDKNSYADFSVSVSPAVEKAVVNGDAPPTIFLNVFDQDSITVGVNEDPEQVLEHFSRNLSRKFSHAPSQALRQASQDCNASLISSTRRLFKLKP